MVGVGRRRGARPKLPRTSILELEQQDEGALMSIGGVMVFEPAPDGAAPTLAERVMVPIAPAA
jgi:hypothetical protein